MREEAFLIVFCGLTTCNCPRYDNNLSKHLLLQIVLTNEVKIRKVEGNKKEYEK